MSDQPANLFQELKRRNVFRVGVAYVITAWLLAQVADLALESFGAPEWVMKTVLLLLLIGFPLALIFAWAFEKTPEGIKLEKNVDRSQSITGATGRKLNYAITALLVVAVVVLLAERLAFDGGDTPGTDSAKQAGDSAAGSETPAGKDGRISIAVLPFVNMSDDPGNEYFSDGISEELLNILAGMEGLQVTSRTSSFAFKGKDVDVPTVARQLGVEHVLEGSVRKAGEQVRITAQLIEVSTDSHLWSDTYTRKLDDVFAIQDEISRAIAEALKLTLVGAGQKSGARRADTAAYDAYLQGRFEMNRRTGPALKRAMAHLERALEIDPNYAPAHAALGDTMILLASENYGDLEDAVAFARGRPYIERALALDPDLAEAHASMGLYLSEIGRFRDAEIALRHAIDLNPGYSQAYLWLGGTLDNLGQYEESYRMYQRGAQIDPLHPSLVSNLASLAFQRNDPAQGRALYLRLIEHDPSSLMPVQGLAFWLIVYGEVLEGLRWAHRAVEIAPGDPGPYLALGTMWGNWLGDPERSNEWMDRALSIAPLDPGVIQSRAWNRLRAGEYEEALAYFRGQLQDALDRDPQAETIQSRRAYLDLGYAEFWVGEYESAARHLERAFGDFDYLFGSYQDWNGPPRLAFARMKSGDRLGADAALSETIRRLEDRISRGYRAPFMEMWLAMAHAMRGDMDTAGRWYADMEESQFTPPVLEAGRQRELEAWLADGGQQLAVADRWEARRAEHRRLAREAYP